MPSRGAGLAMAASAPESTMMSVMPQTTLLRGVGDGLAGGSQRGAGSPG
jgi:hypothetical protein